MALVTMTSGIYGGPGDIFAGVNTGHYSDNIWDSRADPKTISRTRYSTDCKAVYLANTRMSDRDVFITGLCQNHLMRLQNNLPHVLTHSLTVSQKLTSARTAYTCHVLQSACNSSSRTLMIGKKKGGAGGL